MVDCLGCIHLYAASRPYQRTRRQLHPITPAAESSVSTSSTPQQTFIDPLPSTLVSSSSPADMESDATAQIPMAVPTPFTGLTQTQIFAIAFSLTLGVAVLTVVGVLLVRWHRRRARRIRVRSVHPRVRDVGGQRFDLVVGQVPIHEGHEDSTVFEIASNSEDGHGIKVSSQMVQVVRSPRLRVLDLDPDNYPLPLGAPTPVSEVRGWENDTILVRPPVLTKVGCSWARQSSRTTTMPSPRRHDSYGHNELHPYSVGWRDETGAPLRIVIPPTQNRR